MHDHPHNTVWIATVRIVSLVSKNVIAGGRGKTTKPSTCPPAYLVDTKWALNFVFSVVRAIAIPALPTCIERVDWRYIPSKEQCHCVTIAKLGPLSGDGCIQRRTGIIWRLRLGKKASAPLSRSNQVFETYHYYYPYLYPCPCP